MKTIIILIILSSIRIFSQADLSIDLFLHTADYNGQETIHFGLDSAATDGLDLWLGESDLPPDFCPPWGLSFCAFFIFPPFDGTILSMSDFRFGELPYAGQITHMFEVINYESSGNDSIYIRYDLPEGVSIHFIDQLGGIITNLTVEDSGEVAYFYVAGIRALWMYVTYDNVIPAEIISFNGSFVDENNVELKWSTASELNNRGFDVERGQRSEESEWVKIGYVAGSGTTTEPKTYSFTDENVSSGIYKYRLKQIDFDGSFKYSKEIEVEVNFVPERYTLEQNYPNPFNPTTKIKFAIPDVTSSVKLSKVILKVYDIIGREIATLVNEDKLPGVYEIEFDASSFSSGIYLYKMQAGTFIQTKKMILTK